VSLLAVPMQCSLVGAWQHLLGLLVLMPFYCRLKIWWQSDQNSKAKGDKESRAPVGGGGGGGGGNPNTEVIVGGGGGGGGGGKTKKEVKADKVPEGPRPNMITVPESDFTVKETNPDLGKAVDYKQHYDLVEEMTYLFIRVVRARNLMGKDNNGLSDPVSPRIP
jgi:hypothetical protein